MSPLAFRDKDRMRLGEWFPVLGDSSGPFLYGMGQIWQVVFPEQSVITSTGFPRVLICATTPQPPAGLTVAGAPTQAVGFFLSFTLVPGA